MGMDIVGGTDACRLIADFGLKTREPRLPVATIGLALAALQFADDWKELVGIELGRNLGDPLGRLRSHAHARHGQAEIRHGACVEDGQENRKSGSDRHPGRARQKA
jgi:hypothetical protein